MFYIYVIVFIFLRFMIFSSCLIWKTIIVGIMTKMERARALKMLVSCLFFQQDILTFNLLFISSWTLFKIYGNLKKSYFKIYFICCKFLVSSIGNPEQPRGFLRNLTKPEVISSKGPGFVLQPVKIAKLFLSRS